MLLADLRQVQDVFRETVFDQSVALYWATDAYKVLASKIKDIEVYTDQLRKAFGAVSDESRKENSDE